MDNGSHLIAEVILVVKCCTVEMPPVSASQIERQISSLLTFV